MGDREKENKEFQMTVADQRETQKLLTAALNVLSEFYGKKSKAAFVQKQEPAGPPPPPGFEAYKKNAASGGVMSMIQQIINVVKETNASVEARSKEIVDKSEIKAKKETDLVEAK